MGINCLSEHKVKVDCLAKMVECLDDLVNPISIQEILQEVKTRQKSTMQLKRCRRKGCEIFAVKVEDMREPLGTTYQDDYILEDGEIRERLKESFKKSILIVRIIRTYFQRNFLAYPLLGYLISP